MAAFASSPTGIAVIVIGVVSGIFLLGKIFPREGEYVEGSTAQGTEDERSGGGTRRRKKKRGTHRR